MAVASLSSEERPRSPIPDVEKHTEATRSQYNSHPSWLLSLLRVDDGEVYESNPEKHPRLYQRFLDTGAEENGIKPVPLFKRTNRQYSNLFTMFFTCLLCLLP
jgi:hypothetical protein